MLNPAIAEKRPKQMEKGDKTNHNCWDLIVREQVRITPEAIQFGASASGSLLWRNRSCRHPVNEPPVCLGRHQTWLRLYNMT